MNKIFKFMMFAVVAALSVFVSSCGDDDDDTPSYSTKDVVGVWKLNKKDSKLDMKNNLDPSMAEMMKDLIGGYEDAELLAGTITFNEDGTYKMEEDDEIMNGTYSISGNQLKMTYEEDGVKYEIYKGANMADPDEVGTEVTIKDFSISINGSRLVINQITESKTSLEDMDFDVEIPGLSNLKEIVTTITGKYAFDKQ